HTRAAADVGRAAAPVDEAADGVLEVVAPGEREPAVGVVGAERGASGVDRLSRRRDVGVEVLQPKNVGVVTSSRRNAVDVEAGDVVQPLDAHLAASLTARGV